MKNQKKAAATIYIVLGLLGIVATGIMWLIAQAIGFGRDGHSPSAGFNTFMMALVLLGIGLVTAGFRSYSAADAVAEQATGDDKSKQT